MSGAARTQLPRLGVLVTASDTTVEKELPRRLAGVATCHVARMPLPAVTADGLRAMADHAVGAAATLAPIRPAAVLYACTSGTFVLGAEHEDQLTARIGEVTGSPVVTTARSMVEALLAHGPRVRLRTPYEQEITAAEIDYLTALGCEVTTAESLELTVDDDIAAVTPERLRSLVTGPEGDDVVMLSCTNLQTLDLHAELEASAGVPVVTSNAASSAAVARLLGGTSLG